MNKSEFITQFSAKSGGIALDGSLLRKYKYTVSKFGSVQAAATHQGINWKSGITGWSGLEWTFKHPAPPAGTPSTTPGCSQFCFKCQLKRHGAVNHQTTCKKFISLPNLLQKRSFISLGSWGNQASFHPSNCSCMQLPPSAFAPRTKLTHKKIEFKSPAFWLFPRD